MQFGFAGLLNFGHVASMAVSAYTMAILVVQAGVSLWLASLAGIGAAVVFAVLLGLPTLRLRADYLAITTIAFGEIVRYVALNATALTGGSQGTINLAGAGNIAYYNTAWSAFQARAREWLAALIGSAATPDATMLVLVWAVALAAVVAVWLLGRSPWGRVLRSLREDEDAAASLGKNVFAYKLQALVAGAVLGGLAGLFYAYQFSFFSPDDFAPLATFFAWTIVILGGTGRAWAVPVGSLVFGFLYAGTRFFDFPPFAYLDSAGRAYVRLILIGLILIGLMAFRPQGLLGRRREMVLE